MSDCWILTYTGKEVDLLDPQPDMFELEDIAIALSRVNRFNGHTKRAYSVAEHSLVGSRQLEIPLAYEFLLHDAAEAYVVDLPKPLKNVLMDYQEIEFKIDQMIRIAFNLPPVMSREVKAMDLIMLATEKRDLMPAHTKPWPCLEGVKPLANVDLMKKVMPPSQQIDEMERLVRQLAEELGHEPFATHYS